MAKNADKKHAANAKYWSQIMLVLLIVINALYFFVLLGEIKSRGYVWYYSEAFWFTVYVFVERKCYMWIVDELN